MENRKWMAGALCLGMLFSCGVDMKEGNREKTEEAVFMEHRLGEIAHHGFMIGHHDDPVYGIGWDSDANRSDIKSVCGDYPAVMSFDLGRIELGGEKNLDNVSFDRMRKETIAQYERGGMVSFSWHVDNPATGKDSWDVSDTTVVKSVLPGGVNHERFIDWLDRVAAFFNSIKTAEGVKVPLLFRPWHEHTGSWFWWGERLCTRDDYKALWRMTVNRMQEKGATQLLYAYSPGVEPRDTSEYMERYPGDDIIDLFGADIYQYDDNYQNQLEHSLQIIATLSEEHKKPMAITETGYETIPDSVWWTETLLPVVRKYPVSYVLFWRNARERENHFYAPYPGHDSEADFIRFYDHPNTLFVSDLTKIDFTY